MVHEQRVQEALTYFGPHIPRYSRQALARQPELLVALHAAVVKKEVTMQELKALGAVYVKATPEQQAKHHEALTRAMQITKTRGVRKALEELKQFNAPTRHSSIASTLLRLGGQAKPSVQIERIKAAIPQTGERLISTLEKHRALLGAVAHEVNVAAKMISTSHAVSKATGISEEKIQKKLCSIYDAAHEKIRPPVVSSVVSSLNSLLVQEEKSIKQVARTQALVQVPKARPGISAKWFDEAVKLFHEAIEKVAKVRTSRALYFTVSSLFSELQRTFESRGHTTAVMPIEELKLLIQKRVDDYYNKWQQ